MNKEKTNSLSRNFSITKTSIANLMYIANKSAIGLTLSIAFVTLISSCTTSQMTISPRAYNSAVDNMKSEITSVGKGYQLTGSGSDTKNEIKVTGQSYSRYSGFGTLMDNEYAIHDNYTYTDSLGNTVDFQIKHKNKTDYNKKEYVYDIEVTKCSCGDKKLYSVICGDNGSVKKVIQLTPDQKSDMYDPGKTYITVFGLTLGLSLIALLPLLAL